MDDVEREPSRSIVSGDPGAATDGTAYWYDASNADDRRQGRRVLEALRLYRAAEQAMRRRTRAEMAMGENELLTLRYLLRERRRQVRPGELTSYLGISTASTTALLDRLERSGHIERVANPNDRRSIFIRVTPEADRHVRAILAHMHDRMYTSVADLSPDDAETIIAFLHRMVDAVDDVPG